MGFRFSFFAIPIFVLVTGQFLFGCLSYQMVRGVDGAGFITPGNELQVGEATLQTALSKLGAPDKLLTIEGRDVLLYQKTVFRQNRIALSIPAFDVWRRIVDLAVYGGLESRDTLALFFGSDRILRQVVVEKSADRSYLKTIFKEK